MFSTYSLDEVTKQEEAAKLALGLEEVRLLAEKMHNEHTLFLSDEQAAKILQEENSKKDKSGTVGSVGTTAKADGEMALASGNVSDDERNKSLAKVELAPTDSKTPEAVTPVQTGGARAKEDTEVNAENERTEKLAKLQSMAYTADATAPTLGTEVAADRLKEAVYMAKASPNAVPDVVLKADAMALVTAQDTPEKDKQIVVNGKAVELKISSDGFGNQVEREREPELDETRRRTSMEAPITSALGAVAALEGGRDMKRELAAALTGGQEANIDAFSLSSPSTPAQAPQRSQGQSLSA